MNRMMRVVFAALLGLSLFAQADEMSDAKERRKARKADVEQLVRSGDASEGGDGYLVAKAGLDGAKDAVVKAENADRRIGYEAIAKANGKTTEAVGKQAGAINQARAAKK